MNERLFAIFSSPSRRQKLQAECMTKKSYFSAAHHVGKFFEKQQLGLHSDD
jgi:hypothetical protein